MGTMPYMSPEQTSGRAVSHLEQAHASDSQWLGWLKGDRTFDPLRSDPRFAALMRRLPFEGSGLVLPGPLP
jgi:hypothetical protein